MLNKSIKGKTDKYSSVVESTQKNKPEVKNETEEPRITAEQVIEAFESFGFTPNDRNSNDIGYWTTRGQSEGGKLMEELRKRRMEINGKEDEDLKGEELIEKTSLDSKKALPRLSDEEISALFDEYGIPAPDPEWARSNLPNDPQKVRSLLEMQRKNLDDTIKKEAKNKLNAMPEMPRNGAPAQGAPMMGMGGPIGAQSELMPDQSPVKPFFVGDNALVKITNPSDPSGGTLWLVDKKRKVLRPIGSEKVLDNAFDDPDAAKSSVVTLSSQALGPGGPLEGFTPLDQKKEVREDGSMSNIEFSPAQLQKKYGQQTNPEGEKNSLLMLDGLMGNLNK